MDKNVRALVIFAIVIVAAVLFFVLQSDEKTAPAPHEEEHAVHWSYAPGTSPADWGAMDPAWSQCVEGRAQSPIDLTNAKTTQLSKAQIAAFTTVYEGNNQPVQSINDSLSPSGSR